MEVPAGPCSPTPPGSWGGAFLFSSLWGAPGALVTSLCLTWPPVWVCAGITSPFSDNHTSWIQDGLSPFRSLNYLCKDLYFPIRSHSRYLGSDTGMAFGRDAFQPSLQGITRWWLHAGRAGHGWGGARVGAGLWEALGGLKGLLQNQVIFFFSCPPLSGCAKRWAQMRKHCSGKGLTLCSEAAGTLNTCGGIHASRGSF